MTDSILTYVFISYLSIGFGVWLGLISIRLKRTGFKYIIYGIIPSSFIKGLIGSICLWPILIFLTEG